MRKKCYRVLWIVFWKVVSSSFQRREESLEVIEATRMKTASRFEGILMAQK